MWSKKIALIYHYNNDTLNLKCFQLLKSKCQVGSWIEKWPPASYAKEAVSHSLFTFRMAGLFGFRVFGMNSKNSNLKSAGRTLNISLHVLA